MYNQTGSEIFTFLRWRLTIIFLGCIFLSSCEHISTEPKAIGNYPGNVSAIIQANCLGGSCHSEPTALNTGLDLSTWENMTKGSIFLNEIIPYHAAKSHLFGHINTNA